MISSDVVPSPCRGGPLRPAETPGHASLPRSVSRMRPLHWLVRFGWWQNRTAAAFFPTGPLILIAAVSQAPWRAWEHALYARGCQVLVAHDAGRARTLAAEHDLQGAILALGGSGFDNCSLAEELHQLAPVFAAIHILVWSGPPGDEMALAILGETDRVVTASHLSADALVDKVLAMIGPDFPDTCRQSSQTASACL